MSTVNITVGKRVFKLGCGDGEEDNLHNLAADLTARIEEMESSMEGASDTFLLVMAAITMQDELNSLQKLHEEHSKNTPSQEEIDKATDFAVADAIDAIADYVETIAERIEKK